MKNFGTILVITMILTAFLLAEQSAASGGTFSSELQSVRGTSPSSGGGKGGSKGIKSIAIVVDRTGSMEQQRASGNTRGEDALADAKQHVQDFFGTNPYGQCVVFTFAGSSVNNLSGGFVDEATALSTLATMDGVPCSGSTPLADAIQVSCDYLDDNTPLGPQEDRTLAIYTDGGENSSSGPCSGPYSQGGPPYDPGSWQYNCWNLCADKHVVITNYWNNYSKQGGSNHGNGDAPLNDSGSGMGSRYVSDEIFLQDLASTNLGTYTSYGDDQIFELDLYPDHIIGGEMATFTATEGTPNDLTFLIYSLHGTGSTPVPQLNVTLDLTAPQLAVPPTMSDSQGMTTWMFPVPHSALGFEVWLQVAQDSNTTNLVNLGVHQQQSWAAYKYDDESTENLWGFSNGGEFCWMHRFDTVAGGETVTSVQSAFGSKRFPGFSPGNGTPCTLYVWDDPTNDGDPSDCILLTEQPGMVQGVDTDRVIEFALNTPVTVNGVFFVGCSISYSPGQYVGPADETTPYPGGDAFFSGSNSPGGFDPNNLPGNDFPPAEMGNYWLLRAGI